MTTKKVLPKAQNNFSTTLLVSLLLLFVSQFTMAQTVWTVDNRPESGAQYDNVPDAINNILTMPGDIIYIHPSPTTYSNITINKTLTLVGPGHNLENSDGLRATLGTISIVGDALNTVIKGLHFGTVNSSSCTDCDNIQIINNLITGTINGDNSTSITDNWVIEGNYFSTGGFAVDGGTETNWNIKHNVIRGTIYRIDHTSTITNNIFIKTEGYNATHFQTCSNPLVVNNMFLFTSVAATQVTLAGATIDFTSCLTYNYAGTISPLPGSGSNNIENQDPLFNNIPTSVSDFYNNDYTLDALSPAIGTGSNGEDIGLFAFGFIFDVNGRPHSMPYPTEMSITNTIVQPGQDLIVNFKASQKN